jgi:hypothetical protein
MEVVSDHILAGTFYLCIFKGTGPTFNRTKELEVVFSDHILAGLACSIKTGPTFNRTKELEVVFSDIFWQAFLALQH